MYILWLWFSEKYGLENLKTQIRGCSNTRIVDLLRHWGTGARRHKSWKVCISSPKLNWMGNVDERFLKSIERWKCKSKKSRRVKWYRCTRQKMNREANARIMNRKLWLHEARRNYLSHFTKEGRSVSNVCVFTGGHWSFGAHAASIARCEALIGYFLTTWKE